MELSERERRLLQEMESHLLAEDPALASSLGAHRLRAGVQVLLVVVGVVVGVLLMAAGLWRAHLLGILIALGGYLVLLASTSVAGSLRLRVVRSRASAAGTRTP
jgi:Protein of unknown function (DUF3040)